MYDITPYRSNNAGTQTQFTGSTITTSTTRGTAVTITTSTNHSLEVGDIVELDSVTMPTGSSIAASTFEDKLMSSDNSSKFYNIYSYITISRS